MKVRVDENLCVGDGSCAETCPDVFEMRGNVAFAKMENVTAELQGCCFGGGRKLPGRGNYGGGVKSGR